MPTFDPPLLGDGQGNYKIYVVGNSGTGKSTFGAYLSATMGIPHVSLDEIAWKPGWQMTEGEEFKEKVSAWMAQHAQGWIIDGNFWVLGILIPDDATDIIWLDPPLGYYLPRLLWRTLTRLLGLRPPCAKGCEETWMEVFSSKGIVWYCITNHAVAKTKYTAWLSRMNVAGGGKMIRLDESRGELAEWKESLEEQLRRT